jgi:type II secretory pathway component HofQ
MIENNNLDFEILEFNDNFIGEDTLTDKIDALNQSEETEEEEDEDKELINSELVDEDNLEDLDLTEEEKEIILKKKEKEAAKSGEENTSEESEEEEGEEEEANPLKIFASELAEKNLLNLPEDWNGDEEALFEAYEQTLEDRASQIVKQAYKIDNPKVDGLLKYLKNGGDVKIKSKFSI